jgi:hypothetical protein
MVTLLSQVKSSVDLHGSAYATRWAEMTSVADNGEGIRNAPGFQQPMRSKMRDNQPLGHQTAITSPQSELSNDRPSLVTEGSRGHHNSTRETKHLYTNVGPGESKRGHEGTVDERCLYMNMVTGVKDNELHYLPNEKLVGHQTFIYSSLSELSDDRHVPAVKELRRHHDSVINMRGNISK